MAFVTHWSNNYKEFFKDEAATPDTLASERGLTLSSGLSLQADYLYPNALESTREELFHKNKRKNPTLVGCVGNMLDSSFPYESRADVPLPLVMYPTDETDYCGTPVLNWEKYIKDFYKSCRQSLGTITILNSQQKKTKTIGSKKKKKIQLCQKNLRFPSGRIPSADEKVYVGTLQDPTHPDIEKIKGVKEKLFFTPLLGEDEKLYKKEFGDDDEDYSSLDEKPKIKRKTRKKCSPLVTKYRNKMKILINEQNRKEMPPKCIEKFKNIPECRVEGSWNFLYGGHGACELSGNGEKLYVGHGEKLRVIELKESKSRENPYPIYTHSVGGIWEEDKVPINILPSKNMSSSPQNMSSNMLSDNIYEIKSYKRHEIVSVRRGRSLEFYDTSSHIPSLFLSIPNVCYGTQDFFNARIDARNGMNKNPLLLSYDVNMKVLGDIVTLDETQVMQFLDLQQEISVHQYKVGRFEGGEPYYKNKFKLNECGGVTYVGSHSELVFNWSNSQVFLYDRRQNGFRASPLELFNLRTSESVQSFSSQIHFKSESSKILNEWVCGLLPSALNSSYYYLSSTQRIFLFDIRVPKNPVVVLEHGLSSPPAYLDSFHDLNYEVIIGASQRLSQSFSCIFDHSHLPCLSRPSCSKLNPLLSSYPHHLKTPKHFKELWGEKGGGVGSPMHKNRIEKRVEGWSSGIKVWSRKVCKEATQPPGFGIFSSNAYGDVFVQEWDQSPIDPFRRTETQSDKMDCFIKKWADFMTNVPPDPTPGPHLKFHSKGRTADLSLLFEAALESTKKTNKKEVQLPPFNPLKTHEIIHKRVEQTLESVEKQISKIKIRSKRARRFLSVWDSSVSQEAEDAETDALLDENIEIKKENLTEDEFGAESSDVEILYTVQNQHSNPSFNSFTENVIELDLDKSKLHECYLNIPMDGQEFENEDNLVSQSQNNLTLEEVVDELLVNEESNKNHQNSEKIDKKVLNIEESSFPSSSSKRVSKKSTKRVRFSNNLESNS